MGYRSSSDEGEIIESDAGNMKATSLLKSEGTSIDRPDRLPNRRSTSRSPGRGDPGSKRPGYDSRRSRSPRGYKRSRDDRDRDRGGARYEDNRRFRTHYDEPPRGSEYHRTRISYDDLDRPPSRGPDQTFDYDGWNDRDRYSDKRARKRSRSPRRAGGVGERYREGAPRTRTLVSRNGRRADPVDIKYDDRDYRDPRRGRETPSQRLSEADISSTSRRDAKPDDSQTTRRPSPPVTATNTEEKELVQEDFEIDAPSKALAEEAEIERRRRRRDAILSKSSSATPMLIHALQGAERANSPSSGQASQARVDRSTPVSDVASPSSGPHDEPSPDELQMTADMDLSNKHSKAQADDEDGPSAADYDPTVDMKEDELRDGLRQGNVGPHGQKQDGNPPTGEVHANGMSDAHQGTAPGVIDGQGGGGNGDDEDDDDFNMFADNFDVDTYAATKAVKANQQASGDAETAAGQAAGGAILEEDDKDGYYKTRIGEIMNGRYQIQAALGKGMFSGVVRAVDVNNKKLVAIKIMRNNDALRKGGFMEIAILQKLNDADPDNRKHIVQFYRHFDHKGHLCMAFENLSMNLREVLRKFGNNVGINLRATRSYAYQIFVSLAHMRKCSIIHADLKPDNILVNETRNVLKICDLGTAIDREDAASVHTDITPYLVSRFYRAPEIMLGIPYDYAVDMWSIGCTLYELYTGKILFTGESNNQMLKTIMEIRGKLTPKMYKRGQLAGIHFDGNGNFVSVERDKIFDKTTIRTLPVVKPTRDLRTRLLAASADMDDSEMRELNQFIDLLEHCLALNPDKRIKPAEALKHPFFASKAAPATGKR